MRYGFDSNKDGITNPNEYDYISDASQRLIRKVNDNPPELISRFKLHQWGNWFVGSESIEILSFTR